MVGQGVLRECVLDPEITSVLVIGRSPLGQEQEKLREIVRQDLFNYTPIENELRGYDACFFCLGVSSAGMTEADYHHVTYGLTIAAAQILASLNPNMTFIYISGAGTDRTESGRSMWARVKGQTENALLRLSFKAAYMFRPGYIQPLHGIKSKTNWYCALYAVVSPIYPLVADALPKAGHNHRAARPRYGSRRQTRRPKASIGDRGYLSLQPRVLMNVGAHPSSPVTQQLFSRRDAGRAKRRGPLFDLRRLSISASSFFPS